MSKVSLVTPHAPCPTPGPRGARALGRIIEAAHKRQADQERSAA